MFTQAPTRRRCRVRGAILGQVVTREYHVITSKSLWCVEGFHLYFFRETILVQSLDLRSLILDSETLPEVLL